jgi:hypothetical protein
MVRQLIPLILAATIGLAGCGEADSGSRPGGQGFDSTPEKFDGSPSSEFEPDDIERAESASPEVREYWEGAVSEAQELGCLSHVDESEVP